MSNEIQTVDELQYDWPANIVSYDTRYLLGLTMNDLLAIGGGAIVLGMINIFLAPVGAIFGFLLIKRFSSLGDRRLWEYLVSLAIYRVRKKPVTLPRILPVTSTHYAITDLDGVTLAELDGEQ